MNITNLTYFIEIVNCNYNLTKAAARCHISQPALSNYIKTIEFEEDITLFLRKKGRLVGLTNIGERFYENAKLVISTHEQLMADLRTTTKKYKGQITIGIPQLISGIVFSELIPMLIENNPDIKFNIIEAGAYELQKKLILNEVDFAILLTPTALDPSIADISILLRDQLCLYMSNLSYKEKFQESSSISLSQLNAENFIMFDHNFMVHHQLINLFEQAKVAPNIKFFSSSWDLLLNATRHSSYLTILPKPITKFAKMEGISEVPITENAKWEVVLTSLKQNKTSHLKSYIKNEILDYFSQNI